jgi:hypothetical protein
LFFFLLTPCYTYTPRALDFSPVAWRCEKQWHGSCHGATFASRPKARKVATNARRNEQYRNVFLQALDLKDKIATQLQPGGRKKFAPFGGRTAPNAAINFHPNSNHADLGI